MLLIAHRINTLERLRKLRPKADGVELDIRHDNRTGRLYLNHDPGVGDDFEEYLKEFVEVFHTRPRRFIILNIKEAGIEAKVLELVATYGLARSEYFLLDVEFPYIYRASRAGVRQIAIRFSEDEPSAQAQLYRGRVDWLWIDTNTTLPLDERSAVTFGDYKTCLVGPDRWKRPQDNTPYLETVKKLGFPLSAIMVGEECLDEVTATCFRLGL